MKILHVITSLRMGGAEKLMVDLLPRFKQKGIDVDLLVFDGTDTSFKRQLQNAGIKLFELGKKNHIYNPYYIFRLFSYMKQYDIIHAHNTAPQLFVAIAHIFCSIILVTTEHNTSNRRRKWKWYRKIDLWMYSKYDKVICISDKTEGNLKSYLKCCQSDISTVFNGVDVKLFIEANPEIQINTYNVICKKLMMVAGFRSQKDQKTVIRALTLLPNEYELFLVGDGPERVKCESLVRELNMINRVHFLGVRTDIPQLLKVADVVILSSHWEGFGLAVVEGMAAHKPVVATNIDGMREIVQGAGLLFEHENASQLAQRIDELMSSSEFYKKIADSCFDRAKAYDISKMTDEYEKIYLKLVNEKA